jgi:hypothetical protein
MMQSRAIHGNMEMAKRSGLSCFRTKAAPLTQRNHASSPSVKRWVPTSLSRRCRPIGVPGGVRLLPAYYSGLQTISRKRGSEMKLVILDERITDTFNPHRCYICSGWFFVQKVEWTLYADDGTEGLEALGDVCSNCLQESDEHIRALLLKQAEACDTESKQADFRVYCLDYAFSAPDEARSMISEDLEIWRADRIGFACEADRFREFASCALVEREFRIKPTKDERDGWVYLLGSPEGYCKIGRAKRVSERLLQIGLQLPFRVELLHTIKVSDCIWAERFLHQKFATCRMNGEWFLLSDSDISWIKSLGRLEPEG